MFTWLTIAAIGFAAVVTLYQSLSGRKISGYKAGWWSEGLITDEDLVRGLQFLIKANIIKVN